MVLCMVCFFFQAEDGIRDLVRSRGLGDVYKRQTQGTQFLGLVYLPAITFSLLLNATAVVTAVLGVLLSLIHI